MNGGDVLKRQDRHQPMTVPIRGSATKTPGLETIVPIYIASEASRVTRRRAGELLHMLGRDSVESRYSAQLTGPESRIPATELYRPRTGESRIASTERGIGRGKAPVACACPGYGIDPRRYNVPARSVQPVRTQ